MCDAWERELLKNCPACGYSLHSQPVRHRCPECGLIINRRWRVFGGRIASPPRDRLKSTFSGQIAYLSLPLAAAITLSFSVPALWRTATLTASPDWLAAVPVVLFFIAVCCFYSILSTYASSFVAVGPNGVDIHLGGGRFKRFDWNSIIAYRTSSTLGGIGLHLRDGSTVWLGQIRFFRLDGAEAYNCACHIKDYPRRAVPAGGFAPRPYVRRTKYKQPRYRRSKHKHA